LVARDSGTGSVRNSPEAAPGKADGRSRPWWVLIAPMAWRSR